MTMNFTRYQVSNYSVETPLYEGPLDLLLQLIERAELDITRLSLAMVTDQYLQHIRNLPEMIADEVSAFLVIAARLIQIKSEALLPRPPVREPDEEDPGEALARQLLTYKRFRQIADMLGQRELTGFRTYLRLAAPPKIEGTVDLSGITINDLVAAANAILFQNDHIPPLSSVVGPARITVREKLAAITAILQRRKHTTFRSLINSHHNRLEIVVTFLAVLELIKRHLVQATQESIFGDINIDASESWQEDETIETEFEE